MQEKLAFGCPETRVVVVEHWLWTATVITFRQAGTVIKWLCRVAVTSGSVEVAACIQCSVCITNCLQQKVGFRLPG
jgi:hypothetical protein